MIDELDNNTSIIDDNIEDLNNLKLNISNIISKLKLTLKELDNANKGMLDFYRINDNAADNGKINSVIDNINSTISNLNNIIAVINNKISEVSFNGEENILEESESNIYE